MKFFPILVLFSLIAAHFAAEASILPPNNLHLKTGAHAPSNFTEKQFNEIIDGVVGIWAPIIKKRGFNLSVEKLWNDNEVNAGAYRKGNALFLKFTGGLPRRPEVTPDAFALVVCHELGHIFGGHYFYKDGRKLASEGQADYFASQVCAKQVFKKFHQQNQKHLLHAIDSDATAYIKCKEAYTTPGELALCVRTINAGISLTKLFAENDSPKKAPSINTPSANKARATYVEHPEAQCRLDTYIAGVTCTAKFDPLVIPGEFQSEVNGIDSEKEASKYSCMTSNGYQVGVRPRCWFKPQLGDTRLAGSLF